MLLVVPRYMVFTCYRVECGRAIEAMRLKSGKQGLVSNFLSVLHLNSNRSIAFYATQLFLSPFFSTGNTFSFQVR